MWEDSAGDLLWLRNIGCGQPMPPLPLSVNLNPFDGDSNRAGKNYVSRS